MTMVVVVIVCGAVSSKRRPEISSMIREGSQQHVAIRCA